VNVYVTSSLAKSNNYLRDCVYLLNLLNAIDVCLEVKRQSGYLRVMYREISAWNPILDFT
jgi:hypothetical protein